MRLLSNHHYRTLCSIVAERLSIQKENDRLNDLIFKTEKCVKLLLIEKEDLNNRLHDFNDRNEVLKNKVKYNSVATDNHIKQLDNFKDLCKSLEFERDTLKIQLQDTVDSREELDVWRRRALDAEAEMERMNIEQQRLTSQLDMLIEQAPKKRKKSNDDTTK